MDTYPLANSLSPKLRPGAARDEIKSLYHSDTEIRRFVEVAFDLAGETLGRPASLDLLSVARMRRELKRLAALLILIGQYRQARSEGNKKSARLRAEELRENELLSRVAEERFGGELALSDRGELLVEGPLKTPTSSGAEPEEVKTDQLRDWLLRRCAMLLGLQKSHEIAFACSLLETTHFFVVSSSCPFQRRFRSQSATDS